MRKMRFAFRMILAVSLASSTAAYAQLQPPTDADLRTAYCIEVTQEAIKTLDDSIRHVEADIERAKNTPTAPHGKELAAVEQDLKSGLQKSLAESDSLLNRLQLYLLPRISYLDPTGLMGAQARARSDLQQLSTESAPCLKKCMAGHRDNVEQCALACPVTDVQARVRTCLRPTWLPF